MRNIVYTLAQVQCSVLVGMWQAIAPNGLLAAISVHYVKWPTFARIVVLSLLALWSYGMVLAKSCGITSVAALLADLLDTSYSTMRQRLREWCYDAKDKKGEQRQEVDVTLSFAPLLSWVLSWWPASECRLALAMDATTLSDRFTVLAMSVLYRGCAIPVAWKMLRSNEKGAWEPYWKELFTLLQGSVPKDWTVIVLADRGLYAPWLFKHIVSVGWHPASRVLTWEARRVQSEKRNGSGFQLLFLA